MKIKHILNGLITYIPGFSNIGIKRTGGSNSAAYCYGIWLRHLNYISNLINNSTAKSKLVYGHHTWFSVGGHGGEDEEVKDFMGDLLKKCTFDVYMCGHDHNKQVIDLNMYNKKITLIVCGTGGKVYDDYTNYDNLNNNCDPHFISNNLGFAHCNVHGNKLSFDFFNDKNKLEYSHLIKK